ncbi:MAG: hypothetical protein MIO93_09940, partial [ANME-2 cluster archaeon]|nr:hypothetical protein [ANME-2 cluster archaeon]
GRGQVRHLLMRRYTSSSQKGLINSEGGVRFCLPWMDMVLWVLVLCILTSLPWVGGVVYLVVTFMVIGVMFNTMRGAAKT